MMERSHLLSGFSPRIQVKIPDAVDPPDRVISNPGHPKVPAVRTVDHRIPVENPSVSEVHPRKRSLTGNLPVNENEIATGLRETVVEDVPARRFIAVSSGR